MFLNEVISGFVNTQTISIKLLLREIHEVMALIISSGLTLTLKSLVWQKIILLSALMILFDSAPCFFIRLIGI